MRVLTVRHGERVDSASAGGSDWFTKEEHQLPPLRVSVQRTLRSRDFEGDPPLSTRGWRQARMAGRYIVGSGRRVVAVYASPALRSLQTAQGICDELGGPGFRRVLPLHEHCHPGHVTERHHVPDNAPIPWVTDAVFGRLATDGLHSGPCRLEGSVDVPGAAQPRVRETIPEFRERHDAAVRQLVESHAAALQNDDDDDDDNACIVLVAHGNTAFWTHIGFIDGVSARENTASDFCEIHEHRFGRIADGALRAISVPFPGIRSHLAALVVTVVDEAATASVVDVVGAFLASHGIGADVALVGLPGPVKAVLAGLVARGAPSIALVDLSDDTPPYESTVFGLVALAVHSVSVARKLYAPPIDVSVYSDSKVVMRALRERSESHCKFSTKLLHPEVLDDAPGSSAGSHDEVFEIQGAVRLLGDPLLAATKQEKSAVLHWQSHVWNRQPQASVIQRTVSIANVPHNAIPAASVLLSKSAGRACVVIPGLLEGELPSDVPETAMRAVLVERVRWAASFMRLLHKEDPQMLVFCLGRWVGELAIKFGISANMVVTDARPKTLLEGMIILGQHIRCRNISRVVCVALPFQADRTRMTEAFVRSSGSYSLLAFHFHGVSSRSLPSKERSALAALENQLLTSFPEHACATVSSQATTLPWETSGMCDAADFDSLRLSCVVHGCFTFVFSVDGPIVVYFGRRRVLPDDGPSDEDEPLPFVVVGPGMGAVLGVGSPSAPMPGIPVVKCPEWSGDSPDHEASGIHDEKPDAKTFWIALDATARLLVVGVGQYPCANYALGLNRIPDGVDLDGLHRVGLASQLFPVRLTVHSLLPTAPRFVYHKIKFSHSGSKIRFCGNTFLMRVRPRNPLYSVLCAIQEAIRESAIAPFCHILAPDSFHATLLSGLSDARRGAKELFGIPFPGWAVANATMLKWAQPVLYSSRWTAFGMRAKAITWGSTIRVVFEPASEMIGDALVACRERLARDTGLPILGNDVRQLHCTVAYVLLPLMGENRTTIDTLIRDCEARHLGDGGLEAVFAEPEFCSFTDADTFETVGCE